MNIEEAQARLDTIYSMHQPQLVVNNYTFNELMKDPWCATCFNIRYPCPTAQLSGNQTEVLQVLKQAREVIAEYNTAIRAAKRRGQIKMNRLKDMSVADACQYLEMNFLCAPPKEAQPVEEEV